MKCSTDHRTGLGLGQVGSSVPGGGNLGQVRKYGEGRGGLCQVLESGAGGEFHVLDESGPSEEMWGT